MLPYETHSAATGTGTRWPLSVIFHKSKWGNTPKFQRKKSLKNGENRSILTTETIQRG